MLYSTSWPRSFKADSSPISYDVADFAVWDDLHDLHDVVAHVSCFWILHFADVAQPLTTAGGELLIRHLQIMIWGN